MVNGRQGIDHNDIAFIAYLALSFWAFMAYQQKGRWPYLLLLGFGLAAAMLTKWLAGSLVLWPWGLHLLISRQWSWRPWRHLLGTATLALLLFLPWQIYAAQRFPELYWAEWEYNTRHFSEVIEAHKGPWYYHLGQWSIHFPIISLLFTVGLLRDLRFWRRLSSLRITLYLSILAVQLFYAVAATKMPAFTFLLLPIVLYLITDLIRYLYRRFAYYSLAFVLLLLGGKMAWQYFTVEENPAFVERQIALREYCQELAPSLPANAVLFNVPSMQAIDFMFYTKRPAYDFKP